MFLHSFHVLSCISQLDKLIEKTEHEYLESELPSDLSRAESMLEEHKRKKQEISHLINYTADEGEKIVVRVRQTVRQTFNFFMFFFT